jgi:hypothetical protein
MLSVREWLFIVATFVMMCGVVSLPNTYGSPKRTTSLFNMLYADSGAGLSLGAILLIASLVLFLIAALIRKD